MAIPTWPTSTNTRWSANNGRGFPRCASAAAIPLAPRPRGAVLAVELGFEAGAAGSDMPRMPFRDAFHIRFGLKLGHHLTGQHKGNQKGTVVSLHAVDVYKPLGKVFAIGLHFRTTCTYMGHVSHSQPWCHPFVPDVLHFTEHQRRSEAGPSSRESQASTCVSERYPVLGIQVAVSSPPHCGLRALMSSLRSFRHTLLCKPQEKLYVSYVRKPPTKITDHFISLQCSPGGKAKYNKRFTLASFHRRWLRISCLYDLLIKTTTSIFDHVQSRH